ncbi:MAG TPA: GTPase domain-containing protein [Thermoanaerobaculia bacterium]|jgi:hypothetical protein
MTTIAIAGHSNLGKTTLLRTMTKAACGVIADSEGTTREAEPIEYPLLHATFIDCPGFTRASAVWPQLERSDVSIENIEPKYDAEKVALRAIASADVVIYVGSLETVPGDTHRDELHLIAKVNPRIIGLLNKRIQQSKALKRNQLSAREAAWTHALSEEGVTSVFDFDAHWDRYSRLADIYSAIASILVGEKRVIFQKRLAEFVESLNRTRVKASKLAAGTLLACRALLATDESERENHNVSSVKARLRQQVADEVSLYLQQFAEESRKLYEIAVATSEHTLRLKETEFKRKSERMTAMATHSGIATGIGTLLGLAIGAVLGGPVGAIVGAKIGAGIGAGGGLISGSVVETNTHIEVRLSPQDLRDTALFCLAILWCLTHQGFGNDPTVLTEDFERALDFVKGEIKAIKHPEWERCSEVTMAGWFTESLQSLEV